MDTRRRFETCWLARRRSSAPSRCDGIELSPAATNAAEFRPQADLNRPSRPKSDLRLHARLGAKLLRIPPPRAGNSSPPSHRKCRRASQRDSSRRGFSYSSRPPLVGAGIVTDTTFLPAHPLNASYIRPIKHPKNCVAKNLPRSVLPNPQESAPTEKVGDLRNR
jgi:hypothetical protein